MIPTLFFDFVGLLLWPVFAILPEWDPLDLDDAVAAIEGLALGDWIGWVNNYLPVTHGLAALGVILVVTNASFLFNWLVWLLTKLHVLGGS